MLRKLFNEVFVYRNTKLTTELIKYNELYGRIDNDFKRMLHVIDFYIKYVILRKNGIYEKQKKAERLIYPESEINQKNFFITAKKKIESKDTVYFDLKDVLFDFPLTDKPFKAFIETNTLFIGLSNAALNVEMIQPETREAIKECFIGSSLINGAIKELYDYAKSLNKTVFLVNNTNVNEEWMLELIRRNKVEERIVPKSKIPGGKIHITTTKKNEDDILYKNINYMGEPYRPFNCRNVVNSFYNHSVNLKLHSGSCAYSQFYEYGFVCGGILTYGYCQYLNELAKKDKIDKFLFVARDGDVMSRIYKKYFAMIDSSYLIYSRFASYELIFQDFPEEYIELNIRPRIYRKNSDNTIGKIIQECGIEAIIPFLQARHLKAEDVLNDDNFLQFKNLVLMYKDVIQASFQNTCDAAKQYFLQEIVNYKKICIVDLGWHGTSIVYLKHLFEKQYRWTGQVVGALIGAVNDDVVQNYISRGVIHTYAFRNEFARRDVKDYYDPFEYDEIVCIEALFSSPSDTLLRYQRCENGTTDFIYGKKNKNKQKIIEIHKGIEDFVESFHPIVNKFGLTVFSDDAYRPLDNMMKNKKMRKKIFDQYYEEINAINGF